MLTPPPKLLPGPNRPLRDPARQVVKLCVCIYVAPTTCPVVCTALGCYVYWCWVGVVTITNPDGGSILLNITSLVLRPGLDGIELYDSSTVDLPFRVWATPNDSILTPPVFLQSGALPPRARLFCGCVWLALRCGDFLRAALSLCGLQVALCSHFACSPTLSRRGSGST